MQRIVRSVVLAMILGNLAAYGTPASTPSAVSIEQEPAHRLVLQNEHVRVFDVRLPAGSATLWHEHLHDGVSVRLTDSTVEDQAKGEKAETSVLRRGEVAYGATPTARVHRVRNVGESTFHIVFVELLKPHDVSTDRAVTTAPDPRIVIENDRVRALRRILAPGESTDMHVHASRGVGVPITAGRLENAGDAGIEIVDIELK